MATNQISSAPYLLSDANQASYRYNGELPPEEALEQQALNRRQHIANLLIQQGLSGAGTNRGQMVGRFYVPQSWAQGVGDIAKVGAGALGTYMNDKARGELADTNQQALADAVANYKHGVSDVPAVAGSGPMPGPQAAVADAMAGPQAQAAPPPSMEAMPMGPPASPSVFNGISPMGPDESGWEQKGPIQDLNAAAPPPTAPQQQVAQAMVPQPMQGPVSPGTPGRARTPEEKRQALIDLMVNQHPQARQLAGFLANQDERMGAREDTQAFQKEEKALDRQNRIATAQAQMGQNIVLATMAGASKEQIAEMKASNDKLIQEMRGASAENVAKIAAEAKTDVQGMKSGKGAGMSATAQKELFETDDTIASSKNVILSLDKALDLNPKAYDGSTASTRAKALGYVPGKFADADATVELNNIVTGQALEQLRATFGGMPTEGERKILMEIQGSVDMKASQRQAIYERAKDAAKRRLGLNQQKADQLRKGTYFSGEGGVAAPEDGTPLTTVPTTKGKPNAFQPFHDPDEEEAYQKFKREHK